MPKPHELRLEWASDELGQLGILERERSELDAKLKRDIEALKAAHALEAAPLVKQLEEKTKLLTDWASSHRDELLTKDSKTAKLPTGDIQWRYPPPSLVMEDENKTIAALEKRKLAEFVVVEPHVNKPGVLQLVLSSPKLAAQLHVSVAQTERIQLKPHIAPAAARDVVKEPAPE